jgi:hypothetical protein
MSDREERSGEYNHCYFRHVAKQAMFSDHPCPGQQNSSVKTVGSGEVTGIVWFEVTK